MPVGWVISGAIATEAENPPGGESTLCKPGTKGSNDVTIRAECGNRLAVIIQKGKGSGQYRRITKPFDDKWFILDRPLDVPLESTGGATSVVQIGNFNHRNIVHRNALRGLLTGDRATTLRPFCSANSGVSIGYSNADSIVLANDIADVCTGVTVRGTTYPSSLCTNGDKDGDPDYECLGVGWRSLVARNLVEHAVIGLDVFGSLGVVAQGPMTWLNEFRGNEVSEPLGPPIAVGYEASYGESGAAVIDTMLENNEVIPWQLPQGSCGAPTAHCRACENCPPERWAEMVQQECKNANEWTQCLRYLSQGTWEWGDCSASCTHLVSYPSMSLWFLCTANQPNQDCSTIFRNAGHHRVVVWP